MYMNTSIEVKISEFNMENSQTREKVVPQLKLEVSKTLEVAEYACKHKDQKVCDEIKQDLIENLSSRLFNYESTGYWDSPSAYRYLQGWIRAANEIAARNVADSLHLNLDNSV